MSCPGILFGYQMAKNRQNKIKRWYTINVKLYWAACQFMLANSITNELESNCSEEHKPVHVCHV
jgi:hypothetical protein